MNDGTMERVTPRRALKTILGGEPPPTEEEGMSSDAFERWVREAPTVEGFQPVFEAAQGGADYGDGTYNDCTRTAARVVLEYLEAHPEHRDTPSENVYDFSNEDPRISRRGECSWRRVTQGAG